ncbi:uncharacterized protein KLLA0_E12409g [Kluyveromyces lactis]|uniref:KLLA0E12409p n=1 Tax=Kluyveromyces lactis (strain ATCC 8585 / CBS 2359 / DSM 70799 / NBRC 1267 / NRRL Y-1140 / WM37) TaxID=284590 RepID=Q6CNI1_KLULA|nr:uncharacterized protein KLLA0_E12409g [Kluyveromyces lactis]CAG99595.1 KLLA0E12409p [Kluyveromyces lactis]|eukprot:XP_454508.1 uncharacterized protein KLLA0_E12409g [Kluyveromyces lactis]
MSWSQGNVSDVFSLGYDFSSNVAYPNLLLDTELESNLESDVTDELQLQPQVSDFSMSLADAYTFNYTDNTTASASSGRISNASSTAGTGDDTAETATTTATTPLPRQRRYSKNNRQTPPSSSSASPCGNPNSQSGSISSNSSKKVSDSRLSARGLAEVLNLSSPAEALYREKFILDIFEKELHYPLGYKTWVRGTTKEYRTRILYQLHQRVKTRYPEYDEKVLEIIIRRATYYMMQSRLRRERRARAKANKSKSTQRISKNDYSSSRNAGNENGDMDVTSFDFGVNSNSFVTGNAFLM